MAGSAALGFRAGDAVEVSGEYEGAGGIGERRSGAFGQRATEAVLGGESRDEEGFAKGDQTPQRHLLLLAILQMNRDALLLTDLRFR